LNMPDSLPEADVCLLCTVITLFIYRLTKVTDTHGMEKVLKKCLNCGIDVGGENETCPLCQNTLTGDASPYNWPPMKKLKKQAFLYKLQLFIVLTLIVVGLTLDYMLDLNGGKHWSMIISIWMVVVEIVVRGFIKKSLVVAKILSISMLHISMLLLFTSWYYGFKTPIIYVVIPILMCVTLIANLVFSLIDTRDNAMVYLLVNILSGFVSYIVLEIGHKSRTLPWTICLMLSGVTLIGIVIFKGKEVLNEIQKRMNF